MRHSAFFRRTLVLVYGTVAIFALIILLMYAVISPNLFAQNKIQNLIPKGRIIAGYIENALYGDLTSAYLVPLIGKSTSQWEATVWVVNTNGDTLIRTQQTEGRRVGRLPQKISASMLPSVLNGDVATHVGKQEDLQSPTSKTSGTAGSSVLNGIAQSDSGSATEEDLSGDIVAIAVPIHFYGEVVGAVFMAQSMTEVMASMQALTNTIVFSFLAALLILLPIVLYFASRVTRPLSEMRKVALTMAGGDLSVRANDKSHDEFGDLSGALNTLSSALGETISSLAMERNRLQSMINGLSEGVIAVDAEGRIVLMNPAVYALLGLPEGEEDIQSCAPELYALFPEALASGSIVRRTIWKGAVALHLSVSPLTGEDGQIAGGVGILTDVTSAERLEQTRRDYVANVSHELRTPLTAMRALMEPLRDGLIRTEEQRQQTYDVLLRETMRLSRLVSDMLELSRLQSGKTSLARSAFDPLSLLSLIRETYAPYAEDYQQTFVYDVPDSLPRVMGNPDRTQQVLIALLDNAFKYSGEGGTVTLRAELQPEMIVITVADTGIGISEEDLPHVFDRFYKADKSHHSKGTGLGLAIAYEIMKNLGETLTVSSRSGEGAAFSFTLHLAPENSD